MKNNVVDLAAYRRERELKESGIVSILDFVGLDDDDVMAWNRMMNPPPPGVKLVDDDKPSDT